MSETSICVGRPVATIVAPSRNSTAPPAPAIMSSGCSNGGGIRKVISALPSMWPAISPHT
jgi:hypothetical protein